ncbi:hypothetical protein GCM10020331_074280 [Ectobacillus funiculus]
MVSIVKIYIDAGHGGQDSGAVGNGLQEKNIVAEIARQMNQILATEYEKRANSYDTYG